MFAGSDDSALQEGAAELRVWGPGAGGRAARGQEGHIHLRPPGQTRHASIQLH